MGAAARINSLSIGTSGAGQATGALSAGSGTLRVGSTLSVGNTVAGSAQGTLGVGGVVAGNNSGFLSVGTSFGNSGAVVNASGTLNATGVSGFSSYAVGVLSDAVGTGSVAQGSVIASGAAASSSTSFLNVGTLANTVNRASATGVLSLNDASLTLVNGGMQIGQMFNAGRGSVASGSVTIGGNAGTVNGLLIAGNVTHFNATQAGSQSTGQLTVGGNLDVAAGSQLFIGTTFGSDRDGAFASQATGVVQIGGTLRILGDPSFMAIGTTTDGVANGSLSVGALDMGAAARINSLSIGTSGAGQATGALSAGSGTLRVGNLFLGNTTTGSADGTLQLQTANFVADNVLAGSGAGGTAHISLRDSTATIADAFTLSNGDLLLDNSLMTVANGLTLGAGATLNIDIDGLLRGSEYGAIDAGLATLNGVLAIDFSDLVPLAGTMVFDLLRSGAIDGILGDFASVTFIGLQSGYSVLAGIELDGVEVYRVRVASQSVPEPGTWALLLSCVGAALWLRVARPRATGATSRKAR